MLQARPMPQALRILQAVHHRGLWRKFRGLLAQATRRSLAQDLGQLDHTMPPPMPLLLSNWLGETEMACSTTIRAMSRQEISSTLTKKSTEALSRTSASSLMSRNFWQQRYKMQLMRRARLTSSRMGLLLAMTKPNAIWTDMRILPD